MRARRAQRGQSLAEFALMVPVIVIVMLLAVDLGRISFAVINLTSVARIGANYAAQNPSAWQGSGNSAVKTRYQTMMRNDASGIDCTLPGTLPAPTFAEATPYTYTLGSPLRVSLTCRFQLISPFLYGLVGDGSGGMTVQTSAAFNIRAGSVSGVAIGANIPTPTPTQTPSAAPTPTAPPTPTPAPTPTAGASGSAGPTPTPAPTATIPVVSFYGVPQSTDAYGGGPAGSVDENQITGIYGLTVNFTNLVSSGGNCRWEFGDGGTSTSCGNNVTHTYTSRGYFSVSLTVDGGYRARTNYVLVSCKVPAFAGVRKNSAASIWANAGFTLSKLTMLPGSGNYKIGYQSLAGGLINPPGSCSGATVQVGP